MTVTKSDDYNWPVLKPDIFAAIMDHFSTGEPLFTDKEVLEASDTAIHEDDDEVRLPHTLNLLEQSVIGWLVGWLVVAQKQLPCVVRGVTG